MSDEYRHPSATRTTRFEQARALLREGSNASDAELAWARSFVAEHEVESPRGGLWSATVTPTHGPFTWTGPMPGDIDDLIRQRAQRIFDDLEGVHEAEVHAGKIGMLVVWREDEAAANRLAKWKGAIIRVPNGSEHRARSSSGTIHDTEQDRWGVLYRAKDLRRP
jgi:hypothetical protein